VEFSGDLMKEYKVVAVLCATKETEGLNRAVSSLLRNGILVEVYGMGKEWEGNGMKQVAALDIANKYQGKADFILSLDGYDTITIAPVQEIIEKFLSFRHPMVIGAEVNCWPDKDKASLYPTASTRFKHLNGGGYIARIDYLAVMLKEWGMTSEFKASSDQRWLTKVFLDNPGCMKIDYECAIFQNLCRIKKEEFIVCGNRLINRTTHQMPCILHGNGHGDMSWYEKVTK
jgi:hypothetical protein